MSTDADHRSRAETPADPLSEAWMYRSEAFPEDVDHLLTAAVAVASGPFNAASRDPAWPSLLAGVFLGRPQGAG